MTFPKHDLKRTRTLVSQPGGGGGLSSLHRYERAKQQQTSTNGNGCSSLIGHKPFAKIADERTRICFSFFDERANERNERCEFLSRQMSREVESISVLISEDNCLDFSGHFEIFRRDAVDFEWERRNISNDGQDEERKKDCNLPERERKRKCCLATLECVRLAFSNKGTRREEKEKKCFNLLIDSFSPRQRPNNSQLFSPLLVSGLFFVRLAGVADRSFFPPL